MAIASSQPEMPHSEASSRMKQRVTGRMVESRLESTDVYVVCQVVRMMEKMSSKIEKEAEKEEDLYDKFSCYCKKTIAELEKSLGKRHTQVRNILT